MLIKVYCRNTDANLTGTECIVRVIRGKTRGAATGFTSISFARAILTIVHLVIP